MDAAYKQNNNTLLLFLLLHNCHNNTQNVCGALFLFHTIHNISLYHHHYNHITHCTIHTHSSRIFAISHYYTGENTKYHNNLNNLAFNTCVLLGPRNLFIIDPTTITWLAYPGVLRLIPGVFVVRPCCVWESVRVRVISVEVSFNT